MCSGSTFVSSSSADFPSISADAAPNVGAAVGAVVAVLLVIAIIIVVIVVVCFLRK